jgi:hypothetical protein
MAHWGPLIDNKALDKAYISTTCPTCGIVYPSYIIHKCPLQVISPMDIVNNYHEEKGKAIVSTKESDGKIKSDGGPSAYYDFPAGAKTLNDLLEHKGDTQWLGDTFHLANVVKAAWRWGDKEGTSKAYDARKLIYSGCRLLMKYAGVQDVRSTLQAMLDDEQFKDKT